MSIPVRCVSLLRRSLARVGRQRADGKADGHLLTSVDRVRGRERRPTGSGPATAQKGCRYSLETARSRSGERRDVQSDGRRAGRAAGGLPRRRSPVERCGARYPNKRSLSQSWRGAALDGSTPPRRHESAAVRASSAGIVIDWKYRSAPQPSSLRHPAESLVRPAACAMRERPC